MLARLGQAPGAAHVGPAACGQGRGWGRHRRAHAPCRMGSGPAEPGLTQNLSCPGSARLCGPAPPPLSICCFVSSAGGQAAWGWGTRRPRPQAPQSRSQLVPSPQALRVLGAGRGLFSGLRGPGGSWARGEALQNCCGLGEAPSSHPSCALALALWWKLWWVKRCPLWPPGPPCPPSTTGLHTSSPQCPLSELTQPQGGQRPPPPLAPCCSPGWAAWLCPEGVGGARPSGTRPCPAPGQRSLPAWVQVEAKPRLPGQAPPPFLSSHCRARPALGGGGTPSPFPGDSVQPRAALGGPLHGAGPRRRCPSPSSRCFLFAQVLCPPLCAFHLLLSLTVEDVAGPGQAWA